MPEFKDERPVRKKSSIELEEPKAEKEIPIPDRVSNSKEAAGKAFYDDVDDLGQKKSKTTNEQLGNIIDLPSKGMLGYPGSISYRDIMAGDEEVLKTATAKNFSRTVNRVLKSICNNPEHFDELSVHDRDFIIGYIWGNTYGHGKKFDVQCKHCGTKDTINVNITEIPIDDIKEDFVMNFKVHIAKAEMDIYIRPITVRDENNTEKFFTDNPDFEATREFVMMCLAVDFRRPMALVDRIAWFQEYVTAKDSQLIKGYHNYFKFGMDTQYNHTCKKCEGVTSTYIPFHPQDIIAPDVQTDFGSILHAN